MDTDVAYTSCSSIGQKNNLPSIPIFSINTADHISRSSFGPIIARGGAEHVSNLHHAFPQVFMFVLEKRAGHFSPCGCSRVFTVSVGSFEFFDIQRILSPCPANCCRIHVIIGRELRPVPLPGPCSHLDTRNRQKEKHDQCGSRNSQFSRSFHCLPDPPGNVAAPRCTDCSAAAALPPFAAYVGSVPPAVRVRDRLFRASDISGLGGNCRLTTIFMDDDFGYLFAFDQKNDLPYISISTAD